MKAEKPPWTSNAVVRSLGKTPLTEGGPPKSDWRGFQKEQERHSRWRVRKPPRGAEGAGRRAQGTETGQPRERPCRGKGTSAFSSWDVTARLWGDGQGEGPDPERGRASRDPCGGRAQVQEQRGWCQGATATAFPSPSGRQEAGPHAGGRARGVAGHRGGAQRGGRSGRRVSRQPGGHGAARDRRTAPAAPRDHVLFLRLCCVALSWPLTPSRCSASWSAKPPGRPAVGIPGRQSHSGLL